MLVAEYNGAKMEANGALSNEGELFVIKLKKTGE